MKITASILGFIKRDSFFLLSLAFSMTFVVLIVLGRGNAEKLVMEKILLAKSARASEAISVMTISRINEATSLALHHKGSAEEFEQLAAAIVNDPVMLYFSVAPDGVVNYVFPLRGNESFVNMDILKEGIGTREARLAMETRELVLGGPYDAANGEKVLIARQPLFFDNPDGTNSFWGIISVALRYNQVMELVGLNEFELQGYGYEIFKTDPHTGEKNIIAGSAREHFKSMQYIQQKITILHNEWCVAIFTTSAWYNQPYIWLLILISFVLSSLASRLQHMAIRAKEASKAKSDFLASMSHEIRTPMNAIIGMSGLLKEENLTGRQMEYVNDIVTSSNALLGIINDILDVSKIEAGKLTLVPVDFNLTDFTENICAMMTFAAQNKNLDFISEIPDPAPGYVFGDDLRLRQILVNLIGNAVKFTEQGHVKLSLSYNDDKARFEVSDTGVGIKQSDIERLYDSFEQFDSKKNRGVQGTGLGLSITKSLVDMMGGVITVESVYGKGSTFTVEVPMPPGDESQREDDYAELVAFSARGANVLVVDDNEMNRKVSQGLLKLYDIECDTAINGVEAVRAVTEKDYDIVFMDHMMPEMDGVEAAEKIREMGGKYRKGELVIIALTANVLQQAREMFEASGMDGFIAKPIEKPELHKALVKWLPEEKMSVKEGGGSISRKISESDYTPVLKSAAALEGLDVALGLERVNGMEDYERSLRLLGGSIPKAMDELRHFLEEGNLQRFAIDVHGMKGALAINGHERLSKMALELEMRSKGGEMEFCKANFPEFSAQMTLFAGQLEDIFAEGKTGRMNQGSAEELGEALAEVEVCLETCDSRGALDALKSVEEYTFGEDTDEKLERLTACIEDFDYDLAAQVLQTIDL